MPGSGIPLPYPEAVKKGLARLENRIVKIPPNLPLPFPGPWNGQREEFIPHFNKEGRGGISIVCGDTLPWSIRFDNTNVKSYDDQHHSSN